MKPTVTKVKDARGRITGYRATIGPIYREGKTVAEASAACERATLEALARLDKGASAHQWNGHTFTIAPDSWGALRTAQFHLAQVTWTHDVDDAEFLASLPDAVASELAGWIRFQRAYKRLAAEGKYSDTDLHRLACEQSYA